MSNSPDYLQLLSAFDEPAPPSATGPNRDGGGGLGSNGGLGPNRRTLVITELRNENDRTYGGTTNVYHTVTSTERRSLGNDINISEASQSQMCSLNANQC